MSQRRFSDLLLQLEQSTDEELAGWARREGTPMAARSARPQERLVDFVPSLSLMILRDSARRIGQQAIPYPREPLPPWSRGTALFLLAVVTSVVMRLREEQVSIDLKAATMGAMDAFYSLRTDPDRIPETVLVGNKWRELMLTHTKDIQGYLERLGVAILGYVALPPSQRSDVLAVAGKLLQQMVAAVE